MLQHFLRELDKVKKKLFTLSAMVETAVSNAVRSIADRDTNLAQMVVAADHEIDNLEVEFEEDCLKILALHQPVAIDLRFIVAILKINNDLERIGDLAVNIAKRSIYLSGKARLDIPFDLDGMSDLAKLMIKKSLDALVDMNSKMAVEVLEMDDEIDNKHREMYNVIKNEIINNPSHIDLLIRLLGVSRNLERIADHATNIAEDVIYMVDGKIVRHQGTDSLTFSAG